MLFHLFGIRTAPRGTILLGSQLENIARTTGRFPTAGSESNLDFLRSLRMLTEIPDSVKIVGQSVRTLKIVPRFCREATVLRIETFVRPIRRD